ncbi:MAG TPA: S1 RNA-binding domain-containing protein, partial [Candidatus Eisenbacteria bacterium]|nr:S1 RNA-binding domain-containing protein [Candidatus Eisenbacteria bacterium]
MQKSIVINAEPKETRVAILEDRELVELLVERPDERRIVGDIYKGKINAVLPGMQAAFVEIGLAKTAFLHASDLFNSMSDDIDLDDDEAKSDGNGEGPPPGGRYRTQRRRPRREATPRIEDHLTKGQEVVVQVTKEPISTKGPRVSQQVS